MIAIAVSLLVLFLIFLCWKKDMPSWIRIGLMVCAVVAYTIIIIRMVTR